MSRSTSSSFSKPRNEASALRRAGIVTASVLLGSSLIIPGVISSAQAAGTCPVGSTTLSSGACEVTFTSSPATAWTPPAGTSKLHALLVGAGGAADGYTSAGYGGGGGDVTVVALSVTGDVTIAVGAAGTVTGYSAANDSTVTQGGATTTATGGEPVIGFGGGTSGSGLIAGGDGGSGAGAASTTRNGGAGLIVNALSGASTTLFSDDTECFGGGGSAENGTSTCGGGYTTDESSSVGTNPVVANSGGGGGGWTFYDGAAWQPYFNDGAAGLVTLRFEVSSLPDTGSAMTASWLWSAVGLLVAGTAAVIGTLSLRLRRR